MRISSGDRLGPYEIVSRIGAGGMGEVWKGRDTRLDRSIAIKILPSIFASDAALKIRFDREAKTISQLEHPNICRLYDVGESSVETNGQPDPLSSPLSYLVMELLDGETLAARLARGPIPLPDVLRYGAQIAEALDRAHHAGIVHRDLKPGNIMITRSGAKLLDFGLAKASAEITTRATPLPHVEDATAVRADLPLTEEGMILGTFQYMAPEQIEGDAVDFRADIFALGALLYEMLTGVRAFEGKSKTSLIAAIVKDQPRPPAELQPLTPPALEHLITRCLRKEPDERWQSARDIAEELKWIDQSSQSSVARAPLSSRRPRILYGAGALLALAVVASMAFMVIRNRTSVSRPLVIPIAPPRGHQFNAVGNTSGAAVISPDGRHIVFSAAGGDAVGTLWIYSTESGESRELLDTLNATYPFWSPDSRRIAFFSDGKLKRIDITGGGAVSICDIAPNPRGGTWGPDNTILFSPNTTSAIHRVSASGGNAVPITNLDPNLHTTHRWPDFLPDGKHFTYVAATHQVSSGSANGLYLGSLEKNEPRQLLPIPTSASFASGHLLYVRGDVMYAQKVSKDYRPEGEPRIVVRGAVYDSAVWRSTISVARNGMLLFHTGPGAPRSELLWLDRGGRKLGGLGGPDVYRDCRLSPDGRTVMVGIGDPATQLWVHDVERDVRRKFTVDADWSGSPVWSRDGSTVYYISLQNGTWRVTAAPLVGGKAPTTLVDVGDAATRVTDSSPDGTLVAVDLNHSASVVPAVGGPLERLFKEPLTRSAVFSPDGRWIAYVSQENSNRAEVFVTSTRDRSVKWQVSTEGGTHPAWRADGRELFFLTSSDRTLSSVTVDSAAGTLQIGSPRQLFSISFKTGFLDRPYSVAPDGERFLANVAKSDDTAGLTLVNDWRVLRTSE